MRLAQYIVVLLFGIGGLALGDNLGPLSGLLYDWDTGMYYEFSRAVRRYHGIVIGACVMLPMIIVGKLVNISTLSVLGVALLIAVLFELLPFVRSGELFSIYLFIRLPWLIAPFVAGTFLSIGAVHVAQEFWPKVVGVKRAKL